MVGEEVKEARLLGKSPVGFFLLHWEGFFSGQWFYHERVFIVYGFFWFFGTVVLVGCFFVAVRF